MASFPKRGLSKKDFDEKKKKHEQEKEAAKVCLVDAIIFLGFVRFRVNLIYINMELLYGLDAQQTIHTSLYNIRHNSHCV